MTIATVNLHTLKKAKNTVIGNPSAKLSLARDVVFVRTLIDCLNYPQGHTLDPQSSQRETEIRIEAAHVVSSLSYGCEEALGILLLCHAPRAFLYAISKFQSSDPPALRSAFARGLRALAVSIADVVGPSQWGLRPEKSTIKNEARTALDYLLHIDSLDIYLPLLNLSASTSVSSSTQTPTSTSNSISISIAQLLGAAIRSPAHRKAVSEWLPPPDRAKEAKIRHSRGWEKTSAVAREAARGGGWVARGLTALLKTRDGKLQEAALSALAALAKENPSVASVLVKPSQDRETPSTLSTVLSISKSRSTDIQLAACLCATHIFRAASSSIPTPSTPISPSHIHGHGHGLGHGPGHAPTHADDTCVRTVMNIVNRMLGVPLDPSSSFGGAASASVSGTDLMMKTRACFVLFHLVSDDPALCQAAYERGCLESLVRVVYGITTIGAGASVGVGDVGASDSFGASGSGNAGLGLGLGFGAGTGGGGGGTFGFGTGGGSGVGAGIGTSANSRDVDGSWEWEGDEEPENISCLREAALTAIAAISLFDNDIRRFLTSPTSLSSFNSTSPPPSGPGDTTTTANTNNSNSTIPSAQQNTTVTSQLSTHPPILPLIHTALHHRHVGTRYGACQCVRALSRGVAVLRTNIVDSGLGMRVFGVFKRGVRGAGGGMGKEKAKVEGDADAEGVAEEVVEDELEDRRVLGAALAAVCNIVNEFSPLRPIFLEQGLVPQLVSVLGTDDSTLRVSALWAVKNLLRKSSTETKKDVMRCLGWGRLAELLADPEEGVQEQAFNVVRNLAENEDGIDMVFRELGAEVIMRHLESALQSSEEDVVLQAACLLANLSNGTTTHQSHILSSPAILSSLQTCLAGSKTEIRKPAVACVLELAHSDARGRKMIVDAGFVGTLRRICEFSGHGGSGVGTGTGGIVGAGAGVGGIGVGVGGNAGAGAGVGVGGLGLGAMRGVLEDDRDVVDQARMALDWLEHEDV